MTICFLLALIVFVFTGIWHSCGTIQRYPLSSSASRKHRWNLLYWQWSPVWHLLPYLEAHHPNLWRLEPSCIPHNVWSHNLSSVPWSTECWSEETCCQHGSFPSSSLLHAWLCSPYLQRQSTIQSSHCSWTHPANVWRQEHDGCLWSSSRKIPDSCRCVQRKNVNEGSWRTDAEHPEQELQLLCWMDPQQREDCCVWHPTQRSEDECYLHW